MIANLVLVDREMYLFALGLFVTGCAPGGGASNFWTLLLDGNAHLSITMTFISTIASLCKEGLTPSFSNLSSSHDALVDEPVRIQVPGDAFQRRCYEGALHQNNRISCCSDCSAFDWGCRCSMEASLGREGPMCKCSVNSSSLFNFRHSDRLSFSSLYL